MKKLHLVASLAVLGLAVSACQQERGTPSTTSMSAASTAAAAGKEDPAVVT